MDPIEGRLGRILASLDEIGKELDDIAKKPAELVPLVHHFQLVRYAYDKLSETKKAFNAVHDNMSRELVPDALRAANMKFTFILGVGRVGISHRYSCSMLDADRGIDWLKSNGHGGIVKETVAANTLAAFARNLLEEKGTELPDDIFKVGSVPYTSITKK